MNIDWMTFVQMLVIALLLLLLLRGMRLMITVLPMSPPRREALRQAVPILEMLVGAVYLVAAMQAFFAGHPLIASFGALSLVFGGLWLSRYALMNFITGVLLRTGGTITLGDRVRIDDMEGRVTQFGYRVMVLETRSGDEAMIPYSRLSRQSVLRTPHSDGAFRHTFRIACGDAVGARARQVRRVAPLCHWCSAARPPLVEIAASGELDVTVFALDVERGPEIEAYVRAALNQTDPHTAAPR